MPDYYFLTGVLQNAAQIDVSPYFTLGFSNENEGFMPFCKTPVPNYYSLLFFSFSRQFPILELQDPVGGGGDGGVVSDHHDGLADVPAGGFEHL